MLQKMAETIELAFWKVAIPLMTRSKTVRAFMRTAYKINTDPLLKKDIALSIAVSAAGFAFSVAIFSLMMLFV